MKDLLEKIRVEYIDFLESHCEDFTLACKDGRNGEITRQSLLESFKTKDEEYEKTMVGLMALGLDLVVRGRRTL